MLSEPAPPVRPARPALKKALRAVRRDRFTVQLGLDPERAVVLRAPSSGVAELVEHLDGRSDLATLARRHRLPPETVRQVVRDLAAAGVLEEADPVSAGSGTTVGHTGPGSANGRSERTMRRIGVAVAEHHRRLEPDIAAWSLLDNGRAELDRRAATTVEVAGGGRIATAVALLLASAGVGQIVAGDDRLARHGDRMPAGLGPDDVGRPRRAGLRRRLAEVAPGTRLVDRHPAPTLVVLTDGGADRAAVAALQAAGTGHLVVGIRETLGSVGPLVLPGRTSCVRCHDLARTDRDPGWALLVDQLGAPAVEACDGVLATLVSSVAALHVLAWLRGNTPPSVDGTVEFRLPDGHGRRRSWDPHPSCGCLRPR